MTTATTVDEIPDVASRSKSDETSWAMFCHLGGLFGIVFPFGNIIVPLGIWLVQRDKYPLVDDQGKEAVNFQISMSIYLIASAILVLFAVGLFLLIALLIFGLVVIVNAAIRARDGEKYRYPLTIRFIQ
jgi:hypothetical protein